MERFGLDYDTIKGLNSRRIYACSRGYGEWGPYASYGNTAGTNNGMTGWIHTACGYSDTTGTKSLGIGDEPAVVSMALGILAALHARERTGEGQKIEISMQEAFLGFMVSSMHEYFTGNMVGVAPAQVADGYFSPDISDAAWAQLAHLIGQDDLVENPRFATAAARRQHRSELGELVRAWARGKTRQELWEGLRDLGYFGAPVLSTGEGLEDPHIKERQAFIMRDHANAGPTTLLAPWIHLSRTCASIHDDAPTIGQHTDEVLGGFLGLTSTELGELRAQGIVQSRRRAAV